mmetsp:Transcript_32692/g.56876  ORF Transcript_32692/g.56876 Transcript_32692/m.56876 type:complete len:363 (+) Transcript_32692:2933-4021(+)
MLFILLSLAYAAPLLIIEFNKAGLSTPTLKIGNEPVGKLTEEGRAAKELQGRILREAFSEYVPKVYNSSQFMIRTFKEDLYVDSAAAYIKGLLPEHKFKISNVRAERRENDPVLSPRSFCPRIDWLIERDQKNSSRYTNLLESLEPYSDALNAFTNSSSFEAAAKLGEAVHSLQQRNLTLPEAPRELIKLAHRAFTMQHSYLPYGSEESVSLGAYMMLEEVLQQILGVATNRTAIKVAVFTTEDSTFSALLKALEMHNYVPGVDAHLVITVEDNYYMRFFYNEQEREFRQCQRPCVVQHFYKAVGAVTFQTKDEWTAACSVVGDEKGWNTSHILIFVMSAAAVFSMAFYKSGGSKPEKEKED